MPRLPMPTTRTLYLLMAAAEALAAHGARGTGAGRTVAGRGLGRVLGVPFLHLGDDVIDFLRLQLGEHWQADAAGGVGFRIRHGAGDAGRLAPWVARLLVDGDRVVGLGVD